MPLTIEQINLISLIDQKTKSIISSGGNEVSLMIALLDKMPAIKTILSSVSEEEINRYYHSHKGFYQYMKILETVASSIADGSIKVPLD